MPRRSLKNRIKQIIVNVGDETATFNLDSNEDFEKPKKVRDQILQNLRLKLNDLTRTKSTFTHKSQKPQIPFQKTVHHIDKMENVDKSSHNFHILDQILAKDNINDSNHIQIPSNLMDLPDISPDEDWINSFF